MQKIELLSPAGNLEKLKIAINYGADAVYGGTSTFSLRIRSGKEFDMESFAQGIEYAHTRGKKVYVTNSRYQVLISPLLIKQSYVLDSYVYGRYAYMCDYPKIWINYHLFAYLITH